ncbi:hypothetical protein [Xenorhabdus lircayensis]|uniref:Uncharacterized protein n=1 Tax=Xenorhabdus lircayensis TaxID=2763499 RepID=A0ABS0U7R6_9GAMM|nr:hypothetical protein [Xenorhabdus lircayensis]MBI6549928.1 hypothetical protein [Xenorhabdus lircayensis]
MSEINEPENDLADYRPVIDVTLGTGKQTAEDGHVVDTQWGYLNESNTSVSHFSSLKVIQKKVDIAETFII